VHVSLPTLGFSHATDINNENYKNVKSSSTPSNRGEYSSRMSGLRQPSRSSPASLGYTSRGNGEAQQFVKRPAVIGEPRGFSRSARSIAARQPCSLPTSKSDALVGGGEGSAASFAAIPVLFSATDHDMSFALSSVGPATLVMAESSLRVHTRVLLLTLDTNKGAAGPACSSTPRLVHDSLGYYPSRPQRQHQSISSTNPR
jgi:hypothetical protein